MYLTCPHCGLEWDGRISLDHLGWHTSCPVCEGSFDVGVPEGRYVIAFTSKTDSEDPYEFFTDDFMAEGIVSYYALNTPETFVMKWTQLVEKPDGMWYWLLDNYVCFCSGACDPGDIDIICDHFGDENLLKIFEDRFACDDTPKERKFYVDTPLGKLVIWAKHENTDNPDDYPGVYIDICRPGGDELLCCVEYDSQAKGIYARLYAEGDEPSHSVRFENVEEV